MLCGDSTNEDASNPVPLTSRPPLRLLILEDSELEAEIETAQLVQSGYDCQSTRVETRASFLNQLQSGPFDLVLANRALPSFDGLTALADFLALNLDAPFILVSETAGEELAIDSLKAGASDYVLKSRLERLPAVVARALRESTEKRARRLAEVSLTENQRMVVTLLSNLPGFAYRARTASLAPLEFISGGVLDVSGWAASDYLMGAATFREAMHPEDRSRVLNEMERALSAREPFEVEYRLETLEGQEKWVWERGCGTYAANGALACVDGFVTDITRRKQAELRLEHDALHDPLTGLPNRTLFLDRLGQRLKRAQRGAGNGFAVLFIDLDRFKLVNDSLGHLAGDRLLVEAAQRIGRCLRASDTLARVGGDEFLVLLDELGENTATLVASRLQASLLEPIRLDGHEVFVKASTGIALSDPSYRDPEEILRDADVAMYRAKEEGRGRTVVFTRQMSKLVVRSLDLESQLRRALERHELAVHYQPIVSLNTGAIEGFEALVRWVHPQRGLTSPAEFLPVAESSELIAEIDCWVLREACREFARWRGADGQKRQLKISVNSSGRTLRLPDLEGVASEAISSAELGPNALCLEITERLLVEAGDAIISTLERLKALGVELHLDDFGTGYSSLSHLVLLPISRLKIDKTFVRRLTSGGRDFAIVRAMTALARNLGMSVVAEGVENARQIEELRSMNCESAQGYFFSPPVDAATARDFVVHEKRWPFLPD